MQFTTQSNCRPRLKNDAFTNDDLTQLFADYADKSLGDPEFKQKCINIVNRGNGKNQFKKNELGAKITATKNRAVALKTAQDFILAGMGLGV